ncbi:MAG: M48 family metallopeptidase [Opitutales bacterium]
MSFEQNTAVLKKDEISFCRRSNAKRYIAKVDSKGEIIVTIPRGGTQREALGFARQHTDWLRGQQMKSRETLKGKGLHPGDRIWFRGEFVELEVSKHWGRPVLRFADQQFFIADVGMDLSRPLAERLRGLAKKELPALVREIAMRFNLTFKRVSIRDQKTRWGSCSGLGAISLNWRLVLAPPQTAEYIVIHELMHLEEMNHSAAFWALVELACPRYKEHERWLNDHQSELHW